MTKLAVITAFAAVALTSISAPLPAAAQSPNEPCTYIRCETPDSVDSCSSQLGHLRRVYKEDVLGVEDQNRVWVTEFCMHDSLMRSDGNAAYLRPALADNDVIVDVLRSKGYFTEDVYAVKMMGDDTISLYVHRFDD